MLWQLAHKTASAASPSLPLSSPRSSIFMADGRFDGTASFDHIFDRPGNPAPQAGAQDSHISNLSAMIVFADNSSLWLAVKNDIDLP